jgi:hypothetical protein
MGFILEPSFPFLFSRGLDSMRRFRPDSTTPTMPGDWNLSRRNTLERDGGDSFSSLPTATWSFYFEDAEPPLAVLLGLRKVSSSLK